jgi:hypothetical protein
MPSKQTTFFFVTSTFRSRKKKLGATVIDTTENLRRQTKKDRDVDAVSVEPHQVIKIGFMSYLLITKVTYGESL